MKKMMITAVALATLMMTATNVKAVGTRDFANQLAEATGTTAEVLLADTGIEKGSCTRKDAAVLASKAYVEKSGKTLEQIQKTKKYKATVSNKRITGIKGLTDDEKAAIRVVYSTGIDTGYKGKAYSVKRAFNPNDKLTAKRAKTIVGRVAGTTKKQRLTPDAQVCRKAVTKNEREWKYVLDSFPHKFYNQILAYQAWDNGDKIAKANHQRPKDFYDSRYNDYTLYPDGPIGGGVVFPASRVHREYLDSWLDKVRTNLKLRLNYNYKTTDWDKWANDLQATYVSWGPERDNVLAKKIRRVIDNSLVTEKIVSKSAKIVVDPWSMYRAMGGTYVRCYVKFKYTHGTMDLKKDQNWTFAAVHKRYTTMCLANTLTATKLNQYNEAIIDIRLDNPSDSTYSNYGVSFDVLYTGKKASKSIMLASDVYN